MVGILLFRAVDGHEGKHRPGQKVSSRGRGKVVKEMSWGPGASG